MSESKQDDVRGSMAGLLRSAFEDPASGLNTKDNRRRILEVAVSVLEDAEREKLFRWLLRELQRRRS